jgi:hypothetical protein
MRPNAQVNRRRSAKREGHQRWPWPVLASALNRQLARDGFERAQNTRGAPMTQNVQRWPCSHVDWCPCVAGVGSMYRAFASEPSIGTGGSQAAAGQAARMADGGATGAAT